MEKDNAKNKSWDDLIEDWILAYRKWFTKEAKEKVFRILYLYLRGKYLGNKSVEEQYNKITQKIMDKNMMKNQNKPSKLVFHRSEKKARTPLLQVAHDARSRIQAKDAPARQRGIKAVERGVQEAPRGVSGISEKDGTIKEKIVRQIERHRERRGPLGRPGQGVGETRERTKAGEVKVKVNLFIILQYDMPFLLSLRQVRP